MAKYVSAEYALVRHKLYSNMTYDKIKNTAERRLHSIKLIL